METGCAFQNHIKPVEDQILLWFDFACSFFDQLAIVWPGYLPF